MEAVNDETYLMLLVVTFSKFTQHTMVAKTKNGKIAARATHIQTMILKSLNVRLSLHGEALLQLLNQNDCKKERTRALLFTKITIHNPMPDLWLSITPCGLSVRGSNF